ncbi:MAG TPA: phage major capsid protein [Caulobacteraceae bacterium]
MKETKQAAASPEARAAMHEMLSCFEAFKAANDQRLDEIERKTCADGLLEEKVARIDAGLQAAQAKVERALSEQRRPELAPPTGFAGAPRERAGPEEVKAFQGYLRSGEVAGPLLELKALSEGSGADGGYVAPAQIERQIERRLAEASPMRAISTVRTIGAGVYKKPISTVGVEAGWAAETAARPETDTGTLSLLEFPAADLYANPAATQALVDDAFVDIGEWLAAEVQDAFAAQETQAFVNGDGVNKPKGFLSYTAVAEASHAWGQIGYVASGSAGAFAASNPVDKLFDLIYAPQSKYRPGGRFVMNRKTLSTIRKMKDADGNYIWSAATQPGAPSMLLGYPLTEIETMPDVGANTYSIAFGDFAKGYLIVDRAGVRVLRDPYTAKPYVLYYTTKRVGGGVQNFDAIKLMKFAAS